MNENNYENSYERIAMVFYSHRGNCFVFLCEVNVTMFFFIVIALSVCYFGTSFLGHKNICDK